MESMDVDSLFLSMHLEQVVQSSLPDGISNDVLIRIERWLALRTLLHTSG
jgi:hypothetical protein